jgi:hypothetical protein
MNAGSKGDNQAPVSTKSETANRRRHWMCRDGPGDRIEFDYRWRENVDKPQHQSRFIPDRALPDA